MVPQLSWIEHDTSNVRVNGSNPLGITWYREQGASPYALYSKEQEVGAFNQIMKKLGYKEMLRDRCPKMVNYALKWRKAKEKWIDHVYSNFIGI